jgi:hypothetical protein
LFPHSCWASRNAACPTFRRWGHYPAAWWASRVLMSGDPALRCATSRRASSTLGDRNFLLRGPAGDGPRREGGARPRSVPHGLRGARKGQLPPGRWARRGFRGLVHAGRGSKADTSASSGEGATAQGRTPQHGWRAGARRAEAGEGRCRAGGGGRGCGRRVRVAAPEVKRSREGLTGKRIMYRTSASQSRPSPGRLAGWCSAVALPSASVLK